MLSRDELVLAAMTAGGLQASFNPIQIQKLLFLIDQELAEHVGGPHFTFEPHNFGPFDSQVYDVLAGLAAEHKIEINTEGQYWLYWLTARGDVEGTNALSTLDDWVAESLYQCAHWVQIQSWHSLLTKIYSRYPQMRPNSRVPELVEEAKRRDHKSYFRRYMEGFGNILNLFPPRPTSRRTFTHSGLRGDWQAIGDDLRQAVAPFPEFPE